MKNACDNTGGLLAERVACLSMVRKGDQIIHIYTISGVDASTADVTSELKSR